MTEKEIIFFGRHAQRSNKDTVEVHHPRPEDKESKQYQGVTEEGVEQIREKVEEETIEMIEKANNDAVLFISGASEEDRTKSSIEIYGDVLAEKYKDRDDILVITRTEVDKLRQQVKEQPGGKVLEVIQDIIKDNPDKKIIFDYPLFLKSWSLRPGFRTPKRGKHTTFSKALFEQSHDDPDRSTQLWMESQGKLEHKGRVLKGPKPQEVAEKQFRDIKRLQSFTKKFISDRQLIVGLIGHGWNVDALATYLANEGKVTAEGFKKIGGTMMKQSETSQIKIEKDKAIFTYRGKEYKLPEEVIK